MPRIQLISPDDITSIHILSAQYLSLIKRLYEIDTISNSNILFYITLTRCSVALAPWNDLIMKGEMLGSKVERKYLDKFNDTVILDLVNTYNENNENLDSLTKDLDSSVKEVFLEINNIQECSLKIIYLTTLSRCFEDIFTNYVEDIWSILIKSLKENYTLLENKDLTPISIHKDFLNGLFHREITVPQKRKYSGKDFYNLMLQKPLWVY